jgi:hypothetical protein
MQATVTPRIAPSVASRACSSASSCQPPITARDLRCGFAQLRQPASGLRPAGELAGAGEAARAARMGWKRANQPLCRGRELARSLRQAVVVLPILIATSDLVLHNIAACAAQYCPSPGAKPAILGGTSIRALWQVRRVPSFQEAACHPLSCGMALHSVMYVALLLPTVLRHL